MSSSRQADERMDAEAFVAWAGARGGDARYELLDGETIRMSAERALHARTKANVFKQFDRQIGERGMPCEAFMDGMAVRVDDETVFEPDALVRCGAPVGDDVVLIIDPLIVVEVALPSTQRVDVLVKFTRYFRNPTLVHHLIIVPIARLVVHYKRLADGPIVSSSFESGVVSLDPPGLHLDLASLFSADGD